MTNQDFLMLLMFADVDAEERIDNSLVEILKLKRDRGLEHKF